MRPSVILAAGLCAAAPAQSVRDLTGLLPAGTPLVVDLCDGAACVKHLQAFVEPLPRELPAAVHLGFFGLPLLVRTTTGMEIAELLRTLAPGQAAFALLLGEGKPFPVVLSRVADAGAVARLQQRTKIKTAYDVSDGILTVTDTPAHLQEVLRFRASGAPSLLADAAYRGGRADLSPGSLLRFHVDLAALRKLTKGGPLFDRVPDPAKLLLGPLARALDRSKRVDGQLLLAADSLSLRAATDAGLAGDDRQTGKLVAHGTSGRQVAPAPAGTLAVVSLDRDPGAILREPEQWLAADGVLGVKSFTSIADQLLGTASLLEDLLPKLAMPVDLFVTATTPAQDAERPRVTLPAFTFVFGMAEDSAPVQQLLRNAARSFTAIANVQRIADKQVAITLRTERHEGYQLDRVQFGDWDGPGDPPTEHGLSPSLLFAHGHGILSSTVDGALRMAKALAAGPGEHAVGDRIRLDGAAIAALVDENARVLAIDRVLKEGGSMQDAQGFVRGLGAALRALVLDAGLRCAAGTTELELELRRKR